MTAPNAPANAAVADADTPEPDPTRVVPATGVGGLTGELAGLAERSDPQGRIWFDERLRAFLETLSFDYAGAPRTPLERQALATAARDMLARIGLRAQATAAVPAGASLAAGQILANTYRVHSLVARGGVGEIYRARHLDLRTDHAVKILLPRHALDTALVALLHNEARLLQSIRHDGVVGCHVLLRDSDGRLLLVLEYVRGPTLSERLRDGPLPPDELHALVARLAAILGTLHAQHIVHNDISPDNLILRDGDVRSAVLIDFGLARSFAEPGDTLPLLDFAGKFAWTSPEHLADPDSHPGRAQPPSPRSDLYSLGLVIAAAARGRRLDMGHDRDTARAARQSVPPLDDCPAGIQPLLRRLLDPDPATRPADIAALSRLSAGLPGRPAPSLWPRWLPRTSRG